MCLGAASRADTPCPRANDQCLTIYGGLARFRNSDNELRTVEPRTRGKAGPAIYVTAGSESGHGAIGEPDHHQHVSQTSLPLAMLHVEVEAKATTVVGMSRLPRSWPGHKGGYVRRIRFVSFRESAGDVRSLALHRRGINESEERHGKQQQRPVPCHRESRRDQKAPEVERIAGVRVRGCSRQPLVFGDVPGGPCPNQNSDQGDQAPDCQCQRSWPRQNEIGNSKNEAERQSQPLRHFGIGQSASSLSKFRAITIRWISDVPSPISQIFASRNMRSTGYSFV